MGDRHEEKARRPYTERELAVIVALARCSFLPGSRHKRFARNMASAAEHAREIGITEKQARYLTILAWRYRRQMPSTLAYPMIEGDEGVIHGFETVLPAPPPDTGRGQE